MNILRTILIIIFLISALAVTIIVLLQEGKSAGLGAMGGSNTGNSYWEKNKKHSLEGKFEQWTKIIAVVFVLSAFLIMLIPTGNENINNNVTDSILPAPVDGGNENVDANGNPKTTNGAGNVTTDQTPQTNTPEQPTQTNGAASTNTPNVNITGADTAVVDPTTEQTPNTNTNATATPAA